MNLKPFGFLIKPPPKRCTLQKDTQMSLKKRQVEVYGEPGLHAGGRLLLRALLAGRPVLSHFFCQWRHPRVQCGDRRGEGRGAWIGCVGGGGYGSLDFSFLGEIRRFFIKPPKS